MTKPLISEQYRALNAELHGRKAKYGGKGDAWADRVLDYMTGAGAFSYLDYGCGKGNLLAEIASRAPMVATQGYDPVTAPQMPKPADFVTCNDVL